MDGDVALQTINNSPSKREFHQLEAELPASGRQPSTI
jgi:hypothetical protein